VLYRERSARGASIDDIRAEGAALKRLTHSQIEDELARRFGRDATTPGGDVDRPLTPAELRAFAREPLVHLGNHTRDHAILTRCAPHDVETQIAGAQEDLREMAGVTPTMIAYPNGDTSDEVVAVARRAGLSLGITVHPAKNALPLPPDSPRAMRIARFTPVGGADVAAQCRTFRSDVSLFGALKRLVPA
jgi:peptidoglycan/xylan/chitin deacetylase (PgdA/CDA1 family)